MADRPNLPSTSHEANKKVSSEMLNSHYKKIIEALVKLKAGNYEAIAWKCRLDKHQVHRRINELERKGIVYNTKIKTATSSGRSAYAYSLTSTPSSASDVVTAVIRGIQDKQKSRKPKPTSSFNPFI